MNKEFILADIQELELMIEKHKEEIKKLLDDIRFYKQILKKK